MMTRFDCSFIMNKIYFAGLYRSFVCLFLPTLAARAENPHWIWHDNHGTPIQTNEVRFFRKTFFATNVPSKVFLRVVADDEAVVYLNGKEVAHPKDYAKPV